MEAKEGTSHSKQVKALNRVAGQVNGVVRMIEDKRYCIDILIQIKAVKSALASVERQIIDEHINHCVHSAISSKDENQAGKMLSEIKELLKSARL